jgi:tRNA nucleotidyltransferase (CCA-adding enzyme)
LIELLERVDAFRRPERFAEFLQACECDFRGRPGYEARDFPAPDYLMQAFTVARAVDAGAVARASAPENIRAAVFHARAAAVETWKRTL